MRFKFGLWAWGALAVWGLVGPVQAYMLISPDTQPFAGGVVRWVYNPQGQATSESQDAWVATVQRAMDRWTVNCALRFQYDGLSTLRPSDGTPSQVVVGWDASLNSNGVGDPGRSISLRDYSADPWFTGGWVRYRDHVEGVLVHEVGHLIGLHHSDHPMSVMFAHPYHPESGYMRDLKGDDLAGCQALYGHGPAGASQLPTTAADLPATQPPGPAETVRMVVTTGSDPTQPGAVALSRLDNPSGRVFFATQYRLDTPGTVQRLELLAPDGSLYRYVERRGGPASGWFWLDVPSWPEAGLATLPGPWQFRFLVDDRVRATQRVDVAGAAGGLTRLPDLAVWAVPLADGGLMAGADTLAGAPPKSVQWLLGTQGLSAQPRWTASQWAGGVTLQARVNSGSPRYVTASNGQAQPDNPDWVARLTLSPAAFDGPVQAQGRWWGATSDATLTAELLLPRSITGRQQVYVAAQAAGQWFVRTASGWVAWSGQVAQLGSYLQATPPLLVVANVLTRADLSALPRPVSVVLGWGPDPATMLRQAQYRVIATY